MREHASSTVDLPLHQQAMRAKCVHPAGTFTPFRKEEIEQSIPERFEQQVRWYPDRLVVKSKSHQLTYQELNMLANRMARTVLTHGGEGPEPVAVLFEHGALFIAAILGVLKAGKFYVPLDPSYPQARLSYMLRDSQTRLLVTNTKDFSFARELAQPETSLINIEELDSAISPENPGLSLSPDALAYIIYTSGSTGEPKGVMQNHRNVLHKIRISTNAYHLCPDDRRTLFYSSSSSGSVWDIFSALCTGGSLYPFPLKEEGIMHLAQWLIQEEITIYGSVPTLFRHFISTLTGEEAFPHLRLVNLGGEAVSKRDVELYKKHFSPGCLLVTTLAATETGTFSQYFIDKETQITGNFVPVGYPVEDKEVLLLDDTGKAVGFNQVGEITIKGRYLSPGYWQRPDLTHTAFRSAPEGEDKRIYCTGDLGRLLPDGCLVHVGRNDFQVKIRGYRVELAEIEAVLVSLDTIKEVVVMAQENQAGDQRLVAYIVPATQAIPTVSALCSLLVAKLPEYMIPSAFVLLEALPLTPGGKVDRRALPIPPRTRPELDTPFAGPRTPIEESLVKIWADVLGLEQVGIYDHFLELGGHSLVATQLIARVINTFRIQVPIKALFETPTIVDMAVLITESQTHLAGEEEITRMLAEVETLSEEEVQTRLSTENDGRNRGEHYE